MTAKTKPMIGPETLLHRNPFMDINHVRVDFGAFRKDYFIVKFGPRAGVLPVRGGEVLLVRQYRFLAGAASWEIPGGKVDPGEDPRAAAVRECREETGVLCREARKLLTYYPGLDNVDNPTSLYFSDRVERVDKFVPQAGEVEAYRWVPLDEAVAMVFDGRVQDAMSVTGLLSFAAVKSGVG